MPVRLKYPLCVCYNMVFGWRKSKSGDKDWEGSYVPPINRNYNGPDLSYTCPENGTSLKPHDLSDQSS